MTDDRKLTEEQLEAWREYEKARRALWDAYPDADEWPTDADDADGEPRIVAILSV